MKKSSIKSVLVLLTLIAVFCMFSISYAAEYNGLCTKCNHSWVSTSKPTSCPNCGNTGITYSEITSENTTDSKKVSSAANDSVAGQNQTIVAATPDKVVSTAPVSCSKTNAVKPIVVAQKKNPCPGKVYCNHDSCEWGYFYSNTCDCLCYKSSYDAGAECSRYFRCN